MYIDEIDKIAWSEYKIRRLGELVNAIYQVKGTVVATTNKRAGRLSVKWHDADEAATICAGSARTGDTRLMCGEASQQAQRTVRERSRAISACVARERCY